MAFDWGILHWIQNTIACPFLDAVVPKLTMLGNAGIIWILAGPVSYTHLRAHETVA